jgi:TolA-binding protein
VPHAVATAPAAYSTDSTQAYAVVSAQKSKPQTSYPMSAKMKDIAKAEEAEYGDKNADKKHSEVVVTSSPKAKKSMPTAEVKMSSPSVLTAAEPILSRADDHYNKKNYQAAVTDYTQFLAQNTEGDNYERAFFQLANCYLKLNKKADAKVIFEKLSATDGQYQRLAKKALKDL